MSNPTSESERIQALDVLRGFALLGILLLNILGFALLSSAYFNPMVGSEANPSLNLGIWATVDVLFEGAMRGLFSMLFGAGVALFTEAARGKTAALHYKRNVWLLLFGVIDAFVLLWTGDILIVYALAGFLLYPARNASVKSLLWMAGILIVLFSLLHGVFNLGMGEAQKAALALEADPQAQVDPEIANAWHEFNSGFEQTAEAASRELTQRQTSYLTAAEYSAGVMVENLVFVIPVLLFWDALMMMLIGMALYKAGVLNASRSVTFYRNLALGGFTVGLLFNCYEVLGAWSSDFATLKTFGYMQWTYHFGRIGMALGYLAIVMLACKLGWWAGLRSRLAAVGRMALTNYLMHSLIALFLFTGAGLALVGTLQRWEIYIVVLLIWLLQLMLSPWWLNRYHYGPVEWLWRWLTYGSKPALKKQTSL